MLPVMYSSPTKSNIKKIVMDVENENSLNVIPTIIEKSESEMKNNSVA